MAERSSLILASGSRARREMLANAGLAFEVVPAADVDEPAIRMRLQAMEPTIGGEAIARELARAKAVEVAARRPRARVIGADQVLVIDGRLMEKPRSLEEARSHLLELRGRTHELISAAALLEQEQCIWQGATRARLTMRDFTPTFLDDYLARAGARVTESVGAYQLEGLGLQLFERIEGDYFTILGLPLLELLAALRACGVVEA